MTPREQVTQILKDRGAVLVRQRKHEVWRLPDGRNWVRAATPSDTRGDNNNLADLKAMLGLHETRGIEGERRPKRVKAVKPPVRAVLSSAKPAGDYMAELRAQLMATVRKPKPKHDCCYPVDRITVMRTPLSVFLSRLLGPEKQVRL